MSQLVQKLTRLGKDSFSLARAVVQHRGRNVKPLLLEQARNSNSIATSLLQADKEVGLVKYYGVSGYLKHRWQSQSTTTTSSLDDNPILSTDAVASSSTATPTGTTGRIAFMVTAPMKVDMMDRLGYTAEQIKSLTPLQATLIINQSILPEEKDVKLPLAEQEYEEQRQQEEAQARLLHAEQERLRQQQQQQQQQDAMIHAPLPSSTERAQFFGGGYRSKNELDEHHNIGKFFSASEWYEVTETNKVGETTRVGLYQDKDEAELGLKTRRDIAEAKKTTSTFDIHPIDWKELKP